MTPERWKEIEKVYHAALEREPSRGDTFLDEVCAGKEALRREIESLLAHQEQAENFIAKPTLDVAAQGGPESVEFFVAGNQIVSNRTEMTGNIWMAKF